MTKGVQKAGPHLVLLGNLTEEDSLQQSLGNLQVALCCKWVCVCELEVGQMSFWRYGINEISAKIGVEELAS